MHQVVFVGKHDFAEFQDIFQVIVFSDKVPGGHYGYPVSPQQWVSGQFVQYLSVLVLQPLAEYDYIHNRFRSLYFLLQEICHCCFVLLEI